ncbi:MAG: hypothetical protein ACKVJG_01190 [Candidatus Latescibacterota bacterium]
MQGDGSAATGIDVYVAMGVARFEYGLGGKGLSADAVAVDRRRITWLGSQGDLSSDDVDTDAIGVVGDNGRARITATRLDGSGGRADAEGVFGRT